MENFTSESFADREQLWNDNKRATFISVPLSCRAVIPDDLTRGVRRIQPPQWPLAAMIELEDALLLVVRAHAPATTSAGSAFDALDVTLDLLSDLGFDQIALAELAVAIEDAFGIEIDMTELDGCRTLGDLGTLVAARFA